MANDEKITSLKQCETTTYRGLGEEARTEYRKVCQIMIDRGTLKKDDLPVVAVYAQALVSSINYQKRIDEEGPVVHYKDRYGAPKSEPSPYVKMKKDADKTISTYALILGLSPLGRKRLKAEAPEQKSASEVWDEQDD